MSFEQDSQYQSEKIANVEASGERGWFLTFEGGSGIFCTNEHCAQTPQPGETARLYGKGFGYQVRGIVIDGRVYRYLTEAEEEQRRRNWLLEQQNSRQQQLDSERPERDLRRAALPEPFRLRLDGFEAARPEWRREFEAYELFCCEEAARMAERFKTADALREFNKLDHDGQKEAAPELRMSEHSVNTWGASLNLAVLFLEQPDLVPLQHGALCPLVGCQDYGCHAVRKEAGA